MTSKDAKFILVLGIVLISYSSFDANNSSFASSGNKQRSILVTEKSVKRKYRVIKKLSVTIKKGAPQYGGYRSSHDVAAVFEYQARQLGADAVIKVRYKNVPMSLFSWGEVSGTGLAIKYIRK